MEIRRVGMVGAGVMGGGIAQSLAVAGYEVALYDIGADVVSKAFDIILTGRFGLERAIARGKLTGDPTEIVSRIEAVGDLEEMAGVDLVIEAVSEDLQLKQRVFAELDTTVKPEALFATNTSGFPIIEVAARVSPARLERFAGMHFASPVPVMKMCELVHTPHTSADTLSTLRAVAEDMGKVVSLVRDTPGTYGFILNRVFAAARREADKIVADGIATPEDVDRAMINGRNWPVGFYGPEGARTGWV